MKPTALALAAALLFASFVQAAQPRQLAFPVGYTTTVAMPAPVAQVTVADPGLLEVKREGRKVVLVGLEAGRTEVVVRTVEGEQRFSVYVAKDKYAMPY
jgi:Flp pilus assembly secretin CpaC